MLIAGDYCSSAPDAQESFRLAQGELYGDYISTYCHLVDSWAQQASTGASIDFSPSIAGHKS